MFFDKFDENTEHLDNQIEEMMLQLDTLDAEIDNFLKNNNLTPKPEDQEKFENADNFTKSEWETITEIKNNIDETIHKNASNVRNPNTIKKSYSDLHLASHWIPMR